MAHDLGVYSKGDRVRVVSTQAEAVQAVWEGFKRPDPESAKYRDLQAQARQLGIPANQSKAELAEAITNYAPEETTPQGTENADPETPDDDA